MNWHLPDSIVELQLNKIDVIYFHVIGTGIMRHSNNDELGTAIWFEYENDHIFVTV